MFKFFHKHTFDSSKWSLVRDYQITYQPDNLFEKRKTLADVRLYSNTCTECGDLVFREARVEI